MKIIYFLLLLFPMLAFAQNHTTIYGNLDIKDVNIQVLNTQYGTSSDKNGDYGMILFKTDSNVNLLYTCIGYHDTIVSLTPEIFKSDSTEISFKMKKIIYDLPEAEIYATKDFYRSRLNSVIADVSFIDDKILVLENHKKKTELIVLDQDANEVARTQYDSLYNELFIDCFGNYILVGDKSCCQITFKNNYKTKQHTVFSYKDFKEKLQNCMFEYNDAYVFRNKTLVGYDFYYREDHNQSQTYFYIKNDDPTHEKRLLLKFLDVESMKVCHSYFVEIVSEYSKYLREAGIEGANVIEQGFWDGNMLKLAVSAKIQRLVAWYCQIQARQLNTAGIKHDSSLFFLDLDRYKVVEIGEDFKIKDTKPLQILSGEKLFKNQFITDHTTGISYGLFQRDGIYYVGKFDAENGSLRMTTRATNHIYPRVFKINDNYAYGVYFDADKQRGSINRVSIKQ